VHHGACFGTVAMPLLMVLGTGDSIDIAPAETTTPPGEQVEGEPAPLGASGRQEAPDIPSADADADSPAAAMDSPAYASSGAEASTTGYVNVRTRSRWARDHDVDDHDLFAVIASDTETGGENSWGIHFMGRAQYGINAQDPDSIFYSVLDTYSNRLDAKLYHLYVDVPVKDALSLLRLGRMVIYPTPRSAYLDGALIETAPSGPMQLSFGGYAGNSVHLYEGWPSEEWLGGLYTKFRPWEQGQLRVDWMRLNDDIRLDESVNDLVSFDLDHQLNRNLRLEAEYSLLNGSGNDARLKGFWALPEQDLTIRASLFRLIKPQTDFAYELNPYFNSLRTHQPYNQGQFVISKTFDDTWQLYGGLDARRVENQEDIGRYNRDFDRYYLTAAAFEVLPARTTVSLTSDFWVSPDNDQQTWGLDFTSELSEVAKASLGTYYSLYKYYLDNNDERDNVRTYYAEYKREVSDSTRVMIRYEYEDEVIDSFHNLRLGLTWRF